MSEKEIKHLTDLAKKRLKNNVSKKEVLHTFVMAGILNNDGKFTENYPNLSVIDGSKINK
jgi:hypothetical protein